jgi:hypothetical protein
LEISSTRFYPVFVPYELALPQGEDPALRRHLRKKAAPLFWIQENSQWARKRATYCSILKEGKKI